MDDIKTIDGLVLNDDNTFRFVGMTVTSEPVWGEADVMVIDRGPRPAQDHSRSSAD